MAIFPTGEAEAQKGQVTFSKSPIKSMANQKMNLRCPISNSDSELLKCSQHTGAVPRGTGTQATHSSLEAVPLW